MEKHTDHKTLNHKSSNDKEQITNRLKRIEGQVRGIQNMIENDRYCVDILVQISAVQAAMQKLPFICLKIIRIIACQMQSKAVTESKPLLSFLMCLKNSRKLNERAY